MLEHNNQNEEMKHIESENMEDVKKEEMQRSPKPKKPFKGRGFLNTVGAGIIGSVLTLTVLPQTDYYQNLAQPVGVLAAGDEQGDVDAGQGAAGADGREPQVLARVLEQIVPEDESEHRRALRSELHVGMCHRIQ